MSVLGNFLDNDALLSSFDGTGVDGTNGMGIWGRNLSIAANRINQSMSGNPDGISFYSTGFKYLGRKNNNCLVVNQDLYVTYETPSTTIHPAAQLVLQRHNRGFGSCTISLYFMGGALTYEKSQTFRAIFNNYLTAIGLDPIA